MTRRPRIIAGVDVGGTFTDLFFFDEAAGRCQIAKVPSTPADQASGFLDGIATQGTPAGIATIVHGTTVGTNALLERKGARTGVITTKGFGDVLEMRRRDRPRTWGLWGSFVPVVPRDLRIEVEERTLADGTVRQAVDADEIKDAARTLLERGAQAVSVFFVNAYANDENERAAVAALREIWPNDYINASSDILPEIREFERASTTALNAYLQPVIGKYLASLERRLAGEGFAGQLLIVQSNGGVMTVETARRRPIRTALSGPAAGVIASAHIAKAAGFNNVITCDMGGTSFDVSLIAEGQSMLALQTTIDFGLVVRTPMIEIATIGAGGGSIAWVDRGGLLQVGPESAGSDPGPACYGLGNGRPTVTDANVVLGRINAERPIGGKLTALDVAAASRAIESHVGRPLGLDRMAAAEAIVRVANGLMAGAIRLVSIERGYDPKRFAAMPFGGGGALHAGALIKDVGLGRALVPRYPGLTSALGCVIADMRHDFVRTINRPLDAVDIDVLAGEMRAAGTEGLDLLERSGVTFEDRQVLYELDMSYLGQTHTVAAPLPVKLEKGRVTLSREIVRDAFDDAYRRAFGRLLSGVPIRLMNLRTAAIGRRPAFDLSLLRPEANASLDAAARGTRRVWVEGGWHDAAVYARLDLPVGAEIAGPAILEQPDATIFIEPDLTGNVDAFGNVVITRKEAS